MFRERMTYIRARVIVLFYMACLFSITNYASICSMMFDLDILYIEFPLYVVIRVLHLVLSGACQH